MKTFLLRTIRVGNTYSRCFTSKAGRVPIGILTCAVMSLVFCTAARAQTSTGQFNGHVFDQNGAVVADAAVALQDAQTRLEPPRPTARAYTSSLSFSREHIASP